MRRSVRAILMMALILSAARPAGAVILYGKPQRNVRAPAGTLLDSGWQWEGKWGQFLGTAISRQYFVTAGHIGGKVGDPFVLNGVSYKTLSTYDDPMSDLQIWKIKGQFPNWAPLFKENSEIGRGIMIYGRGTQRGDEITVNNQLKGWLWGTDDAVQSWGKNSIRGLSKGPGDDGSDVTGQRIFWTFDRNGTSHEGTVSAGDSGGGVFVKTGKIWRLVGVNHSAEAEFSFLGSDVVQSGAIFDAGGLVADGTQIADKLTDIPTRAYATRISTRVPWIFDVVQNKVAASAIATPGAGVPEPQLLVVAIIAILSMRRHAFHCRGVSGRGVVIC